MQLTGREVRSASAAGYKALWSAESGYPPQEFFAALDRRLENAVTEKLPGDVLPIGSMAGRVTESAAALTGLAEGTPVAVSIIDAYASMPAKIIPNS